MEDSNSRYSAWQNMALPMVLIVTGVTLLGGDYLGILSLDRIQNLWPLAVIAIGLVELIAMDGEDELLLARAREERETENHARQL